MIAMSKKSMMFQIASDTLAISFVVTKSHKTGRYFKISTKSIFPFFLEIQLGTNYIPQFPLLQSVENDPNDTCHFLA